MLESTATVNYLTVQDTAPTPRDVIITGNNLDPNETGTCKKEKERKRKKKKEKERKIMKNYENFGAPPFTRKEEYATYDGTYQGFTYWTKNPLKSNYFDKRVDCQCGYGWGYGFKYSKEK